MQFALLISVLIAVLLSSFLLLTHVQSFFRIKSNELIEASDLAHLQLITSLKNPITKDTLTQTIEHKTIKTHTTYHGAWTKTSTFIEINNRKIAKKIAYTGTTINKQTPNLYLANNYSPLVVVGNTRIEGNNYIPEQGIKAGNISGDYYYGTSLYHGRTIESKKKIPSLDPNWISYLDHTVKGIDINEKNNIQIENELTNSFYTPTKTIYSTTHIRLGNQKIAGNINIQSATKITVNTATLLTDVTLIAPVIVIENDVKGSMQMIATKKIEIGKRCHLSYPSSVIFFDRTTATNPTTFQNTAQQQITEITIDKHTKIDGAILYIKKNLTNIHRAKANILIQKGVECIGEIYCHGNIDFQGTVKGSLYTNQFVANQKGSVYLNHLYNAQILRNPIPKYAGIPFKNSTKNIVKWLY